MRIFCVSCGYAIPEKGAEWITRCQEPGCMGQSHPVCPNCGPHPRGDGTCRHCGGYAFSGFYCDGCLRDMDEEEDGDYYDMEDIW